MNFLHALFSGDGFMPHGMCYMWQPGVMWLHIASDFLIAAAYYSIPITLVYFVRRRPDLEFSWIYLCFALFIVACGTTHLMEILNIWHPVYWLSGAIKALTAMVSLVTAFLLVRLVPKALVIPSPNQLRQANDELRSKTGLLEAANQELEAFSYSVSHDLRAPLRNIQGFSEILQQEGAGLDESAKLYLSRIVHSTQRMGTLIDDLLAFSKMSNSQLSRAPVDMSALAEEVARELGESEARNRSVEWKIAPLPRVVGDVRLLKQVWLNLLGNAVKYSRDRTPARIEVGAAERDGDFEFFVKDNGVGFAMESATRLFGIFERLDQENFEGTGVGLANVRRIVERHGGTTRAESAPGQGATFYFTLPKEKDGK